MLPSLSMATAAAQTDPAAAGGTATPGDSPYGPLATEPDEHGLLLPAGFTSRIIGVAGEPVGDTDYPWHAYPDGAACFDDGEGGWYYAGNSEIFDFVAAASGGVSAVHFGPDGEILDAYRILDGSNSNCAGGPTPWGTWLSCEENGGEQGRVWECDPTGETEAVAHEAMGRFAHEAAAVDPDGKAVYLTQDNPTGVLYRFTPTAYPDLSAGLLEAAFVDDEGVVTWQEVPDPSGTSAPTRQQLPGAAVFPGAEGIWYHSGFVYFTTKYDHSVHSIELATQRHRLIWKGDPDHLGVEGAVLSGVDNITVDATGDLFVAEDGGNMELVLITADGTVAPFARIPAADQADSEITGPCFNPAGDRLYFSSQRAPTPKALNEIVPAAQLTDRTCGVTFEITGPFRGARTADAGSGDDGDAGSTTVPPPTSTLGQAGGTSARADDDDGLPVPALAGGAAVVAAVAAGALALRRRRAATDHPPPPPSSTPSPPPDHDDRPS